MAAVSVHPFVVPTADKSGRSRGALAPILFEWLFTLAALAFLIWQAGAFHEPEFIRSTGERYREAAELRVPLAARVSGPRDDAALARDYEALTQSLARPVKARLARLAELENRAREARAEADVQGAIDGLQSETRAYREAYGISGANAVSLPLHCAWTHLDGSAEARAALLDGDAGRATEAAGSRWPKNAPEGCAALGAPRQVVTSAANIVSRARSSEINAGKAVAARSLLTYAPWYFAIWAVAGLVLLQIGRMAISARRFLPLAGLIWGAVGWVTQVHVEWLSDRSAQTAKLLGWGVKWPDFYQVIIAVSAVLFIAGIAFPRRGEPQGRLTSSSRIGYAGFVLFVGLGWWLLLDLSGSAHFSNRFHALYQQVYVFSAFVLLTVLAPMRLLLADTLNRWLGLFLLLARARGSWLRRSVPWVAYGAVALALLAVAAVARQQQTQLTSEVFRLWLLFGVSWFFFARGETALALSSGTLSGGKGRLHGLAFAWPLAFVLFIPLAGLVLTDDFGPLFVMLYGASLFLGAAFAFAYIDRAGYRPWLGGAVGVLVAGAWVYLVTFALFSLPAPLARIAERLASVRNPFTATNDQMAIITWFQESAPSEGYGFGAVPWCGEILVAGCRGVPRQIQSDYIYTALVGVYGKAAAAGLVALLALWLVRVVIHHSRATRGVVALASPVETQQAWLSWIAVCWVGLTLAQLMITVAGNLGWLPLTGITFPFLSFGAWSLLANTLFLGLAISLPRKAAR